MEAEWARAKRAVADATELTASLRVKGFDVVLMTEPESERLDLAEAEAEAAPADFNVCEQ